MVFLQPSSDAVSFLEGAILTFSGLSPELGMMFDISFQDTFCEDKLIYRLKMIDPVEMHSADESLKYVLGYRDRRVDSRFFRGYGMPMDEFLAKILANLEEDGYIDKYPIAPILSNEDLQIISSSYLKVLKERSDVQGEGSVNENRDFLIRRLVNRINQLRINSESEERKCAMLTYRSQFFKKLPFNIFFVESDVVGRRVDYIFQTLGCDDHAISELLQVVDNSREHLNKGNLYIESLLNGYENYLMGKRSRIHAVS